jgi:thiol reductant ABC exporter CydC subunit
MNTTQLQGSPGPSLQDSLQDPMRPRLASLWRQMLAGQSTRTTAALTLSLAGQLSALGLLAISAWLLTTASLRPPILLLSAGIAAVRLLALTRGLGRYGERLASHDVALRSLAHMRVWAYRHLERLVPGGIPGFSAGDVLSRIAADIDALQDIIVRVGLPLVSGALTAVAAIAVAWMLDPTTGMVLGAGLLLVGFCAPWLARSLGRRHASELACARGNLTGASLELIEGTPDILSFQAGPAVLSRVRRFEQELSKASLVAGASANFAEAGAALLAGLTSLGLLALGSLGINEGRLSGVAVATIVFVALASFDALSGLPDAFAHLDQVLGGARRVAELQSMPSPVPEPTNPVGLPKAPFRVSLRKIEVTYPARANPALSDFDLELTAGKKVALVGRTGSGKSTVARVLLAFLAPSRGSYLVNGIDASRIEPEETRSLFGWASQDAFVFATSVAGNLRLARPSATEKELVESLEVVGLGDWLNSLPEGLWTPLGERGTTISGGERQRLGLARAVLSKRPFLVLDEPTSQLDPAREQQTREQVLAFSREAGVLWITHRLGGLGDFDEVIVLEGGRVRDRGSPSWMAGSSTAFQGLLQHEEGTYVDS